MSSNNTYMVNIQVLNCRRPLRGAPGVVDCEGLSTRTVVLSDFKAEVHCAGNACQ